MSQKTNILLITTDEQRFDAIGCFNKYKVNTPHLDSLAANGAYHPHTYTVNCVCMPARCSLLTGLYSHQHGIMNNRGDLNPSLKTMPQALQKQGYTTALVGKEHFFEGFCDLKEMAETTKTTFGFDHFWSVAGKSMIEGSQDEWTHHLKEKGLYDTHMQDLTSRMDKRRQGICEASPTHLNEDDYVDHLVKEKSIDFLNEQASPFFLWTSFCNPHFPFDPPKKYLDKYRLEDMPLPFQCPPDKISYFQEYYRAYFAMIEQVDTYVGEIIATLKRNGQFENTLIVFTSDHGDMMGDFGLFAKTQAFDGATRVPFLAHHPQLIKAGVYKQATEISDVCATFIELAGSANLQEELPNSPSQSLLKLWQGGDFQRQYAFSELGGQFKAPFYLLADQDYKFIYYPEDQSELLFDLKNDPHEGENIILRETQIADKMRKALLQRIAVTSPPHPSEWIYQQHYKTASLNPNRCHHGGVPERINRGLQNII
ncbi:sulfatase-like hydrolase/transferase [Lentisphaera profundi]|uniref:Sulfatase-like hydrolase/transferase n=1 Tax=Lentisphaera profundi TaxID=1658616 RepID=A0ABY7VVV6_9BACT|nr:sulfatase-like hydrolase/transferase [Lentisphaera profundi]WDE97418.1 sulfatase-like hydrolase/transferase [Lentisphaera profundi]